MICQPNRLFAYRLALALGLWDVDAMLEKMSPETFLEWKAYEYLEPFGFPRQDFCHAQIVQVASRGAYKMKDVRYSPDLRDPGKPMTASEVRDKLSGE